VLELDGPPDAPAVLNVFGGKLTTYRRLAEAALDRLRPHLPPMGEAWTAHAALPGGDFPVGGDAEIVKDLCRVCADLPLPVALRLARTYGMRAASALGAAHSVEGLGCHFGAGLYEREAEYLIDREWARSAEDILWRRTKLGLRFDGDAVAGLEAWLSERTGRTVPTTRAVRHRS